MKRRQFLSVLGGGVILAAGGAGYAVTRQPELALRPWAQAGAPSYRDPRKRALSYAILAPNPHNRQPWLVDLSRTDKVVLTVDTGKMLPHTDPFNRQITIGLGCFLELMVMAAAIDGFDVALDLFPSGTNQDRLDTRPVAVATFRKTENAKPDALFAHVLSRRSSKDAFDTNRAVSTAILQQLATAGRSGATINATRSPDQVQELRSLTGHALEIELNTPHTYRESVDLFRIGHRAVNANPDGIDFSGPFFEALHLTGQFSKEVAYDQSSSVFQQSKTAIMEAPFTAMAHIWLVTEGNSRTDQISSGRDWVRINLAATMLGIGIHPLSQALQEFEEMSDVHTSVHSLLAPDGGTVQMLARLGYSGDVPPSPRWPLESKLLNA